MEFRHFIRKRANICKRGEKGVEDECRGLWWSEFMAFHSMRVLEANEVRKIELFGRGKEFMIFICSSEKNFEVKKRLLCSR